MGADVVKKGIRIVDFPELKIFQIGAFRWFEHDFGDDQPGQSAGGSHGFKRRIEIAADGGACDRAKITDLGESRLRSILTTDGRANINRGWKNEGNRTEWKPG